MKVWKRNLNREENEKLQNMIVLRKKETMENEEKDKTFKKPPEPKKDINA